MILGRTIIRNASFMGIATTAQKVLSFFYFAAIARMLGAEDTGVYFYALSVAQVLSVVLDGGFANYIVRETAKDRDEGLIYTRQSLGTKLILISLGAMLVAILSIGTWLPLPPLLLALAFIVVSIEALQVTLYAHLRGLQKIGYEAVAVVVAQLVSVGTGLAMLFWNRSVALLIGALILASVVHLVYSYLLVRRFTGQWIRPAFQWRVVTQILSQCWPFAATAVFVKVISYTDTVVLGFVGGHEIVGYYSIPYKLTFSFQFIPLALIATLYPALSELYHHQSPHLRAVLLESMRLLWVAAAAISFGMVAVAHQLIPALYGVGYAPSVSIAQVLPLLLLISFVGYPLGALLNSSGHQRYQSFCMAATMIASVAVNILLVPRYGMMGAVLAAFIAHAVYLGSAGYKVHQILPLPLGALLWLFARVAATGTIMVVAVRWALGYTALPFGIIVGAVLFIIVALLSRILVIADARRILGAFHFGKSVATYAKDSSGNA